MSNSANSAGALSLYYSTSGGVLDSCEFDNNTATMYSPSAALASVSGVCQRGGVGGGGAICANVVGGINFTNSVISNNLAMFGGRAHVRLHLPV